MDELERVARKLCENEGGSSYQFVSGIEQWRYYIKQARQLIKENNDATISRL